MKYAREVIDLMACYPGREFRMAEILRHVTKGLALSDMQRGAVRQGVRHVLLELIASGQVEQEKRGSTSAVYAWSCKLQDAAIQNCKRKCNNTASLARPY